MCGHLSRLGLLVVACAALTACATRQPPAPLLRPSAPPPALDVTLLIERGCYRCLEDAYRQAETRGLRQQAFETAALLALRSKELGLPATGWLKRAEEHATPGPASVTYLEIVAALPSAPRSGIRDDLAEIEGRRRARASLLDWREALRAGPASDIFRAYLDVSLVCAFGRLRQDEQSFSTPLDPVAAAPLYRYRVGICDSTHASTLQGVREADPAFVDADFALGRYAFEDPVNPDPEGALTRLAAAAKAFPASAAIATTIGEIHRAWEEWQPALEAFDAALAASPDHPEAMLGRTISLSRLLRSHEAIETATRLIDLGQWRVGEAYYWRAWNYLLLDDYEAARRDADRARPLMVNAALFVLSGTIEWRLQRLQTAEQEFQQALTLDLGECEAAFNLGIVRDQLGKQREALAAFRQAGQCYELSIKLRGEVIARIRSGSGTETAKARAAAAHERVLADLLERRQEVARAVAVLEKVRPS